MIWLNKQKFFNYYLPLGLSVVLVGLGIGSYLILQPQTPQAEAAVSLVAHNSGSSTGGTDVSNVAAINSSGASLLVATACTYNSAPAPTFSDSNGNTWHKLTGKLMNSGGGCNVIIAYAYDKSGSPLVTGSNNTISITTGGAGGFEAVEFMAFSGTVTSSDPFDQQNGTANNAGSSSTTFQPGSITPTLNGELVISALGFSGTDTSHAIDSSFTISDQVAFSSGNHFGSAGAYLIQSSASAINPTWSDASSQAMAATIASFKAAKTGNYVQQGGKYRQVGGKVCIGRGCKSTIAFVNADHGQTASVVGSIATTGTSTVSGNLIYTYCSSGNGDFGTPTVTDTAGNTYTQIGSTLNNGDNLVYGAQFYAKNITGNANNVVTCHFTNSKSFVAVGMIQLSGVDLSNPVDQAATGTATSATSVTSGSFTYSTGEAIVAGTNNGGGGSVHSAGAGYTMPASGKGSLSAVEYDLSSATNASATYGSAVNLNIMVAVFKPLIR